MSVHKELRQVLEKEDPNFTNGRGDEGGWAPKLENQKALEISAKACENLGFTLGKEVSLGVDFASSTQWNEEKQKYIYDRAGFENSTGEQIDFAANIIEKYKLIYAEDAVHEEAFRPSRATSSRCRGSSPVSLRASGDTKNHVPRALPGAVIGCRHHEAR